RAGFELAASWPSIAEPTAEESVKGSRSVPGPSHSNLTKCERIRPFQTAPRLQCDRQPQEIRTRQGLSTLLWPRPATLLSVKKGFVSRGRVWNGWAEPNERIQVCVSGVRATHHSGLERKREPPGVSDLLPEDCRAAGGGRRFKVHHFCITGQ